MTERFRTRIDVALVANVPLVKYQPQGMTTDFASGCADYANPLARLHWVVRAEEDVQSIEVTSDAMAAILAELAEKGWPEA